MSERLSNINPERYSNAEQLKETARERSAELSKERERSAERRTENDIEQARNEALERAASKEHEENRTEHPANEEKPRRVTKQQREASFEATMNEMRRHMSAPSQQFSKFIHNKPVERISDAVGGTIARPNAILSGSMSAFVLTLVVYLVARFNGYPLSGSETMAAFAIGWAIGLTYDYLRLIVTGKK